MRHYLKYTNKNAPYKLKEVVLKFWPLCCSSAEGPNGSGKGGGTIGWLQKCVMGGSVYYVYKQGIIFSRIITILKHFTWGTVTIF